MGRARLSVWILLFVSLRTINGQLCLNNNNDQSGPDLSKQLIAQWIQRKANQQNQIPNNSGNSGINLVLEDNKLLPQQLGILQRNAQQQFQNGQHPSSHQQQTLTNQICQQTLNQQQSNNAQHQSSLPVTNLQLVQTPISTSEITFSPLPVVNNQFAGLPSQVSQGVLLSNLGLTSSLPSLLPNACGTCAKPPTEKQQVIPQNCISTESNVPIGINLSQGSPVTITTSSVQQPKCSCVNNPSQMLTIPVNLQNVPQQNQQVLQLPQTVTITQSQPMQSQNQIPTIYQQTQQQPVVQVQNQLAQTSIQSQPSLPCFSVSSNTPSYHSSGSGSGYNSNVDLLQNGNYGSKPSSIRALLPLIVNLLKEKPCCNNCQPNNCGCMNPSCNGNNVQQPQIISGYSQAVKVAPVVKEENIKDKSSENETTQETNKKMKLTDSKEVNKNEEDYDDDDDYYDDFDENSE